MMYFKRLISLVLLASTVAVILGATTIHAADARNYKAGRIIDNDVFTDTTTMTAAQIQDFLDSKMPSCDINGDKYNNRVWMQATYGINPPYRCVNTFRENPDTGANNYGTAVNPAGSLSAAELIYKYSKQFNINPQVLIVTLQKENGMITDDFPIPRQFQQAMGFGCPDNVAPGQPVCDPAYNSFSNQLYQAARHFRGYINRTPGWDITFDVGWQDIMWSPDQPACGSGAVFIENQATAALYTYTPYQPNDAAKNAQYGLGDGCSAYGNRNFYLYFTDWFGRTTSGLIKAPNGGIFFLDENGYKRAFPDEITLISHGFKFSDAVVISESSFNSIPYGLVIPYNTHYRDGKLVNAAGGMFIIENGLKRPFPDEATFTSFGYTWASALMISPTEASYMPYGAPLPYNTAAREGQLLTAPGVGVYLIQSGTKRPIASVEAFTSWSYSWRNVVTTTTSELSRFTNGEPLFYNTHYRDGKLVNAAGGMFIIENGLKRPFPDEATFTSFGYTWASALVVAPSEVAQIPYGEPLPFNTHFRDGKLITSPGLGIYLVENGVKRPFPSESIFMSYGYKWADVISITNGEISRIPSGNPMVAQ